MVGNAESNKRAKENGRKAEELADELLADLLIVNKLLDGILDGRPIEIKSCQEFVKNQGRWRHGRFQLLKKQHEELLKRDGLYLFIVFRENKEHYLLFLPARLVKYPSDKDAYVITWTKLFLGRGKTIIDKNWERRD